MKNLIIIVMLLLAACNSADIAPSEKPTAQALNQNGSPKEQKEQIDKLMKSAEAYYQAKQYERAIQDLTQVIKLDPKNTDALNNRGFVYDDLKQHALAIQDYTQALVINPNLTKVYVNRGFSYAVV